MTNETIPRDTLLAPIAIMLNNGVPVQTFIDVGSADGTFGLTVLDALNPALHLLNIDAQETYTSSLLRIQAMLGEPFVITALSAHNGRVKVSRPQHEYWMTTAFGGEDDVACRTLDSVWAEAKLPGPCFIKIDVEGGELSVLNGAAATLQDCCGLLIESPARDASGPQFLDIYKLLADRDFLLFDLVRMSHRGSDATLYQFYSVFIAKRFDFRAGKPLRSSVQQDEVLRSVIERRESLKAENAAIISSIKLKRAGVSI